MASASDPIQQPEEFDRRRVVVLFIAQYLVLALLLFLPAGDLGWRKGWLFFTMNRNRARISAIPCIAAPSLRGVLAVSSSIGPSA
jgi:hypothetical protein